MDNEYIKNPEDEFEIPWFLLKGGIFEAIRYDTFESFNEGLWQLLVALTSNRKKTDEEKIRLSATLDKLELMVKGCHYFLYHKKRLGYRESWIDLKWSPNPYRCLEKYRSEEDRQLNHHLAHFREPFSRLTREEAQDFTLAFRNFFAEMGVSSWLNLLDNWKSCLNSDETLPEWADNAPLTTYEKLLSLHEACIVAYHWAEIDYPPPNRHLYEDFFNTTYESYRDASPLELIGTVFYELSYDELRHDILELYAGSANQRTGLIMKPDDVRYRLRWLLQTGWLLLQTDYFPEDWLDPDSFDFLRCPVPEKAVEYWRPKNLSVKESRKLTKTLSELYCGINIHDEIYSVESRIIFYLNADDIEGLDEDNLATRDRLLKTLDILSVIALDLCKRRTKPGGIVYPDVAAFSTPQ